MEKSSKSDLLMAAVFMICTAIGWWQSNLVVGAIVGIALGLTIVFFYNVLKSNKNGINGNS